MGWDAFATQNGVDLELIRMGNTTHLMPRDADLALAFGNAANSVSIACGAVDGSLRLGSLNCSECRRAIDRCGGFDPWTRELTPEQVQVVVRDWKHLVRPEWEGQVSMDYAEASAFAFLKVCAEHGLGVRFSW